MANAVVRGRLKRAAISLGWLLATGCWVLGMWVTRSNAVEVEFACLSPVLVVALVLVGAWIWNGDQ